MSPIAIFALCIGVAVVVVLGLKTYCNWCQARSTSKLLNKPLKAQRQGGRDADGWPM